MLVGYVSDENYVAIPGVLLEFVDDTGSVEATSRATGAIYAELPVGRYRVTLSKAGFTAKTVEVQCDGQRAHSFRLMSDRMCGFMWPKWVRSGEASEYCVHATQEFRLDLWRYGWDKQFVRSYGWCDEHGPRAMAQVLPDGDFSQTGVDWNRVGYTLEFQKHALPAPAKSGLYYLHATTRGGEFCAFPWIVSPARPQARIAVLASTLTWNAYNKFGGRSNYFNQEALPDRPVVNARQELKRYTQPDTWPFQEHGAPLSFQRPEPASEVAMDTQITDTIPGRVGSCFAAGEWRLLGWLEREGFDYDLYSETELHFNRVDLEAYDVLVLNNHPEYWSSEMYHTVKTWVFEQGGKLVYPGGCGLYAEAEFADEWTIRCRREGVWDQRGESAEKLLGVSYTHSGFQTGAPYRVLDASHWAFSDTGLNNGDAFGQRSLHERCPGGASAHELDKIGAESPEGIQHLAKGLNPDDQGADMIIFETPSGGSVFSAGSLCWTLCLPIDDQASQVMKNVLRRFVDEPIA